MKWWIRIPAATLLMVPQMGAAVQEKRSNIAVPGRAIYMATCAACHGDATNKPPNGVDLFILYKTKSDNVADYVKSMIVNGRASRGMPSFRDDLSAQEIAQIATFVDRAQRR